MIISASRRTDIPCHYPEWFLNRIKERHVLVRNPMNPRQVSKISLSPEAVDCIVFWTKNPGPLISHLDKLKDYRYYFQFTVNAYGHDIEPGVPSKNGCIIPTFQKLSEKIGAEKVIWRYDPILLNGRYTANYHITYFEKIASKLKGCTKKCTISFIDLYRSIENSVKDLKLREPAKACKIALAKELSRIASCYNIKIDTCAEKIDLSEFNISRGKCVDARLIERICGYKIKAAKDKNQRPVCGCAESVDIGAYGTCISGCRYCYANHSAKTVAKNRSLYDPASPLLCGTLSDEDTVTERVVKSLRVYQTDLFE